MLRQGSIGAAFALVATAAFAQGAAPITSKGDPGLPVTAVKGCGWYVVLGCYRAGATARKQLQDLGGPLAGGGAGLSVVDTDNYPNFRNGYRCVMDGPYGSSGTARSIAWIEAVPNAYVKSAC